MTEHDELLEATIVRIGEQIMTTLGALFSGQDARAMVEAYLDGRLAFVVTREGIERHVVVPVRQVSE